MNKKYVLGVSFEWGKRKGEDVFAELRKYLDDSYIIIMVGTNKFIDNVLPDGIISIHQTESQKELARIYSAADVFVNPTRDEALGMVNLESLACGTPVITFQAGGSPECIDEQCGMVVPIDDVDALVDAIKMICESNKYDWQDCVDRARLFSQELVYLEYIKLYNCVTDKDF